MKTKIKVNRNTVNLSPEQHVRQFRKLIKEDKNLTVTEYRTAYGIPDATFYNWRRKYAPTLIRK